MAAEGIVELLKEFGRFKPPKLEERPDHEYWQDFRPNDPRWWLSRKLGETLSAQSMSLEIATHISKLISWEISRGQGPVESSPHRPGTGLPTSLIELDLWRSVRDALADLWDWWGEGVHLRPQPKEQQKMWNVDPPYVFDLVKLAMRRSNYNRREPPRPLRTVTVDANLGYGLFLLNCWTHSFVSQAEGFGAALTKTGTAQLWATAEKGPRRYQVLIRNGPNNFVQFSPGGLSSRYFRGYAMRINAAGFAPMTYSRGREYGADFPSGCYLQGVNLESMDLTACNFSLADMRGANLAGSRLERAVFGETRLADANLKDANLFATHMFRADVNRANLSGANMYMSDVRLTEFLKVSGLTQEQVLKSIGSGQRLPDGIVAPDHWELFASRTSKKRQAPETEEQSSGSGVESPSSNEGNA